MPSNDQFTPNEVILQLISICRVQVILANRKKHKLRIYEEMLERIEKVATNHE